MLLCERISLQFVEYAVQVQIDALHHEKNVGKIGIKTVSDLPRRNQDIKQLWRKDIIVHLS